MEVAVGAISPLLRKLGELLKDEYSLEKRVKKGVRFLERELEMMQASLRRVAEVPPDKIDEQVKIWAGMVRELSYDMENTVDAFMVHVEEGREHEPDNANMKNRVKKFLKKTTGLFSKGKALHQIAAAIKEAQDRAKQLAELRQRWCDLDIPDTIAGVAIDPRLIYLDVEHLVGIDQTRDELIKMLTEGDEGSNKQLKTVSIVGFGGLGKTTLARAAYEKIKMQFDCGALVSVSRIPDITKIFKKVLYELNEGKYANINEAMDEAQLIKKLRGFLQNQSTRLPNGMRNLTSLEVLTGLDVGGSPNIVKELVHLTQLRVLGIYWDGLDESLYEALVESLSNLHKIHVLMIHGGSGCIDLMGDGWVPPPNLRTFEISARFCSFKTLPTWINSSSLPLISRLQIWVKEVRPEDIQILGMLPVLRSLSLGLERDEEQVESSSRRFVVSADAFPCARECKFVGFVTVPSMFPQGAAPRLESLKFWFRARDIGSGDLDGLCMGSLPSLQRLEVTIWYTRASHGEVKEAAAALRHAADVHANSPTLAIDVVDGRTSSGLLSAEEAISWMIRHRLMVSLDEEIRHVESGLSWRSGVAMPWP